MDIISSLTCDSLLIMDSLNGLIDSLNMFDLYKMKIKKTTAKSKTSRQKIGGYQSLNILLLLLKKVEDKKIPIVITIYQSLEQSRKMVNELLLGNSNLEKRNHFLRISSSALFLEYNGGDCKTGFTIVKNKGHISSSLSTSSNHCVKVFLPYSGWFYHDFIK